MAIMLASNEHRRSFWDKKLRCFYSGWDKSLCAKYDELLCGKKENPVIISLYESKDAKFTSYKDIMDDSTEITCYSISLGTNVADIPVDLLNLLEEKLTCIIVHGGNTFDISYLAHKNGWHIYIKNMVKNFDVNYIGYSAGAILATPSILSAQWADSMTKEFLNNSKYSDGLGLVDFSLKPHSDSYLPNYYQYFKAYSLLQNKPFLCIYEMSAVVVEKNGDYKTYGKVFYIDSEEDYFI